MAADPVKRWAELTKLVAEEFWAHSQDPSAVFEPDGKALRLRVRVADGPAEWFSFQVQQEQLLSGDLRALAADFYASYRADQSRRAKGNQ